MDQKQSRTSIEQISQYEEKLSVVRAEIATRDLLPLRVGPPPQVYAGPPQHQLDQLPTQAQWQALRAELNAWGTAVLRPSRRSVPGTLGLHLPDHDERSTSPECFLLDSEFAHHHPNSDGGMHLVLPPEWHSAAIEKGWAIPHPMAGQPTISPWIVLVYAPRNETERRVALRLIDVAERFARGKT